MPESPPETISAQGNRTGLSTESWRFFCADPGEASFARFYDETRGFIFSICVRMLGDEDEAFDVMQTVYSDLLVLASDPDAAAAPDIDDQIYRLAVRQADVIRSRRRRRQAKDAGPEVLDLLTDSSPRADIVAHSRFLRSIVTDALDELPDALRAPVQLHYVQGLTHDQVAEELSISRSAASRLIYKALAELKSRLHEKGITESAILLLLALGAQRLWVEPPRAWDASQFYTKSINPVSPLSPGGGRVAAPSGKWALPKVFAAGFMAMGALLALIFLRPAPPQPVVAGPGAIPAFAKEVTPRSLPRDGASADLDGVGRGEPTGTGRLTGRTVALTGGEPVAGVRVVVENQAGLREETITSNDGQFASLSLKAGRYIVRFEPPAPYAARSETAMLLARSGFDLGEVHLRRLASLRGRIIREGAGPLQGVKVQLTNAYDPADRPETETDSSGRFEYHNLIHDSYRILTPGTVTIGSYLALFPDGQDRDIEIELGDGVVQGTVLRGGKPFPGAFVSIGREYDGDVSSIAQTVGDAGRFSFSNLAAGTYHVTVDPVLTNSNKPAQVLQYLDVHGTGTQERDLILPSGRMVGTVTFPGGAGVPYTKVRITSAESSDGSQMPAFDLETSTTASGDFAVELLPGNYLAVATISDGSSAVAGPIEVPFEGDSEPLRLPLQIRRGATVLARALDHATGQRIETAWCDLATPSGTLRWPREETQDGAVVLRGVPPGTYSMEISSFGYTAHQVKLQLSEGQTTELVGILQGAGGVRWRILSPDSKRAVGVSCLLEPVREEGGIRSSMEDARIAKTDKDGMLILRGLLPGRYRLTAEGEGAFLMQEVRVSPRNLTDMRSWMEPLPLPIINTRPE